MNWLTLWVDYSVRGIELFGKWACTLTAHICFTVWTCATMHSVAMQSLLWWWACPWTAFTIQPISVGAYIRGRSLICAHTPCGAFTIQPISAGAFIRGLSLIRAHAPCGAFTNQPISAGASIWGRSVQDVRSLPADSSRPLLCFLYVRTHRAMLSQTNQYLQELLFEIGLKYVHTHTVRCFNKPFNLCRSFYLRSVCTGCQLGMKQTLLGHKHWACQVWTNGTLCPQADAVGLQASSTMA